MGWMWSGECGLWMWNVECEMEWVVELTVKCGIWSLVKSTLVTRRTWDHEIWDHATWRIWYMLIGVTWQGHTGTQSTPDHMTSSTLQLVKSPPWLPGRLVCLHTRHTRRLWEREIRAHCSFIKRRFQIVCFFAAIPRTIFSMRVWCLLSRLFNPIPQSLHNIFESDLHWGTAWTLEIRYFLLIF